MEIKVQHHGIKEVENGLDIWQEEFGPGVEQLHIFEHGAGVVKDEGWALEIFSGPMCAAVPTKPFSMR